MTDWEFSVLELRNNGDDRGRSFSVPTEVLNGVFPVADMHAATIEPGSVRGNHFHAVRREILLVMSSDRWSFHWDEGEGTPVQRREFTGLGSVLVTLPTGMSHAIRNDGDATMHMVGLSDLPYDPARPDVHPRQVVPVNR